MGWRKDPSKIDPDSPAAKKAKERKPKSSQKLPAVTDSGNVGDLDCVTLREPNDGVFSPTKSSDVNKLEVNVSTNKQPSHDIPHNLPPKKFFKSKAAQKENVQAIDARASPPPNPENERTNFRKWLDDKLSPIKGVTSLNVEPPITNGTESEGNDHIFRFYFAEGEMFLESIKRITIKLKVQFRTLNICSTINYQSYQTFCMKDSSCLKIILSSTKVLLYLFTLIISNHYWFNGI